MNFNDTKEHRAWRNARNRCHNPGSQEYFRYGARGITVCDEWRNDFARFIADVGYAPSKLHTLERANNNEGYRPGNVIWATAADQARNRRNNRRVVVNGQVYCLSEACKLFSIAYSATRRRVNRDGWSPVAGLFFPLKACPGRGAKKPWVRDIATDLAQEPGAGG
jgi:hypothetical protein